MVTGRAMSLAELLEGLTPVASELAALRTTGLCLDSRAATPGVLFIALRGAQHDGHRFIDQAAEAGAVAALAEEAPARTAIPAVVVPGLRQRLGTLASRFYAHPSESMHVTAVTGTNGKTTVAQLYAQLVRAVGYSCGSIGTLGASTDGRVQSSLYTTPDAIELQRTLADWVLEAVPFASMEASSHALDQGRMTGVDVDTAVFTNLTRDHLDYHGDMQAYGDAKAKLFEFPSLRAAVLNADDAFSDVLRRRVASDTKVLAFSERGEPAEVRISRVEAGARGLRFRMASPWGEATVRCSLIGAFNVANVACALIAALQAGLPLAGLIDALESLTPVPGRMQPLRHAGGPLVVVDFAHTPDALKQVLDTLRAVCAGRLIVVFGCGGDRDRGKRTLMGEAVSSVADLAVITSDNPRSEDPLAIIRDVEAGMRGDYRVCVDREAAIRVAIESGSREDCVLIAGKGHESFQIIGDQRRPFDDAAIARHCLEAIAA